jgi:CelD/BcsL family acetyltransferase involved in cellulose biosynthesis
MRDNPGLEVTVARDAAALAAVVPQWQDLAAGAMEPNPLYEHWMMLPALAGAAPPELCCVLVWRGERLDALFPFQRARRLKRFAPGTLTSWSHRSWMLCTPLVRAAGARESLGALFDWLAARGEPIAEFRYLPSEGCFYGALADALRERRAMAVATESFTRALLRKGGAPEAALSGPQRRQLARKERRLRERGELRHVTLRPGDDAARWIEDFLDLEANGWKGRVGGALASSEEDRRFALAALTAAFRMKRLVLHGLDFEGRAIARHCHVLGGEGSFFYRTAFDEDFAYYSPGVLAGLYGLREFDTVPEVKWIDSISDPENPVVNRLWKDRRTMQNLVVGVGAWGELWASAMLPAAVWGRRAAKRGAMNV